MQDLSFILNHLGEERSLYFDAVAPPIIQSSNFCQPTVALLRDRIKSEFDEPFYTRGTNPTVKILREKVAALEGMEDALIFSSGSAAVASGLIALVNQGDHVICVDKPYSWTRVLLSQLLSRFGVRVTFLDGCSAHNFERAILPETRVIYLETPNSLTFELQDLAAVARIAKAHNCITICDNSYASPLFQRPAKFGIDLVVHSASKYLAGHGDVVAGVLCGSKERIASIFRSEFMTLGACISPNDAWLMIRGLRTIHLRMERSAQSAAKVADFLANHPSIEKIYFPFHPTHPQHALAKSQMSNCPGLLSVLIRTDSFSGVERFCDNLQYFLMACSWGGHESLAFPLCALKPSMESYDLPLPWNLVRLYIGLEDVDVLIDDLQQALAKV